MKNSISKTIGHLLGIFFVSFLIILGLLGGYLAGAMLLIASEAPKVDSQALLSGLSESSKIVDQKGHLVKQLETAEFRKIVPIKNIPSYVVNAFVSAEDKRFWHHKGVDLMGVITAMKDLVTSGQLRGASTITMQLARNVYLNYDVNWTRKIQEMYLALQMEEGLTAKLGEKAAKEKIMEGYLNRIFFGQQAYGIEAASQIYFSKPAKDLTLPQAAAIASIIPAPSHYSLYSTFRPSKVTDQRVLGETTINGERYVCVYNPPAYERARYVLNQMLANGYITQKEHDDALAIDVASTIKPPSKQADSTSTYITDLVKKQALTLLMDSLGISKKEATNKLYYGGLIITTTIDLEMQQKLQDSMAKVTTAFNETIGRGSEKIRLDIHYDKSGNIVNQAKQIIYFKKNNLLDQNNRVILPKGTYQIGKDQSLTIQPGRIRRYGDNLSITNYFTTDEQGVLRTHQMGSISISADYLGKDEKGNIVLAGDYFKNSDVKLYEQGKDGCLLLNPALYTRDEVGVKQPQLAVTVLDTKTGDILASIGGRENDGRHFLNRAASFPRLPGSSIKPIAEYATAIDQGFCQGSVMDDTPYSMLDDQPWPSNNNGRYKGLMTMREGLVQSVNTVAVKWLEKVGLGPAKEMLTRFGIINKAHPDRDHFITKEESNNGINDENLSLAVGSMTRGLTTLEMANAYQAIGNGGERVPALCIAKIEDNTGKVYFDNTHPKTKVLNPQKNYQLLDMLVATAAQNWVARSSSIPNIEQAGKTGTTNDKKDFWSIMTNPYYTTACWVGVDNAQVSMAGTSATAVSLNGRVLKLIMEGKKAAKFDRPEGLYEVPLCTASGMRPSKYSRYDALHPIQNFLVSSETEPKDVCQMHVSALVDSRNHLLAGSNTPDEVKTYQVFTKRVIPYDPGKFNGILPEDWIMELPTRYSNLGPVEPASSESTALLPEESEHIEEEAPTLN